MKFYEEFDCILAQVLWSGNGFEECLGVIEFNFVLDVFIVAKATNENRLGEFVAEA